MTGTRDARVRWPWLITSATIGALVAAPVLGLVHATVAFDPEGVFFLTALAAFSVVGAIVVSRVARQPIGRSFLLLAFGGAVSVLTDLWVTARPPLPGRPWAAIVNHLSIPISIGILPLVLLRFPDGTLASPRWRWVERLAVTAIAMVTIGSLLLPTFPDYPGLRSPLGVAGARVVLEWVAGVGWTAFLPTIVLGGVSQVLRYRRSTGEDRERLKWFAYAGFALAASWIPLVLSFDDDASDVGSRLLAIPYYLALVAFPILCGFAILRYRLFDIDVVIRRTVVFSGLAMFITGVYVAIVVGIGTLIGSGDRSGLALQVAATACVAVAFEPVRARVQRFANRLVFGERATPYEVIVGLSHRVSEAVSIEDVLPEMARASGTGIRAEAARVRLLLPDGERVVRWPDDVEPADEPDIAVPVRFAGEDIGEIAVWKRRDEPLTPAERQLLDGLASQAGLAMHNVRLAEDLARRADEVRRQSAELRRSRERLVTARDVQRRRLERDIREGPHRQLLAIGSRLREAVGALERDRADDAAGILDELGERANATLEDLRDLARGIFPPLLADRGLVAALEAHVRKVGANATVVARDDVRAARFDAEVEATAYFCCLQAIRNVLHHAGNPATTIELTLDATALTFTVRDTGPGFDPTRVPDGMGLQIMRDRIDALDGVLQIASAPGAGTTVTGRLPARVLEVVAG